MAKKKVEVEKKKSKPISNDRSLKFVLDDERGRPYDSIKGRVAVSTGAVEIFLDDYGTNDESFGMGAPIVLELVGGELNLCVWADINEEEPTDKIDLRNAKEDARAVSEADINEAWAEFTKEHISPAKLFAIGTGMIEQDKDQSIHFSKCRVCERTLRAYQGIKQ